MVGYGIELKNCVGKQFHLFPSNFINNFILICDSISIRFVPVHKLDNNRFVGNFMLIVDSIIYIRSIFIRFIRDYSFNHTHNYNHTIRRLHKATLGNLSLASRPSNFVYQKDGVDYRLRSVRCGRYHVNSKCTCLSRESIRTTHVHNSQSCRYNRERLIDRLKIYFEQNTRRIFLNLVDDVDDVDDDNGIDTPSSDHRYNTNT